MSFDVLVVGAGLAGLRAAERLARCGFRTLLADQLLEPGRVVRTTGIFVRRTLDDFEIPETFLGPAVRRVSLTSPSGRSLELESDRDEFRVGRMRALYRYYFDRTRCSGVRWLGGSRFVSAVRVGRESLVTLRSSTAVNQFAVRYIVGADGARSAVARELGLDRNQKLIVGVEDVFLSDARKDVPRFRCFLDPNIAPGYLGWLIDDGEEVHVGVGGDPRRFSPDAALDELRRRVADQLPSHRVERRAGLIPVGGVLPRIANERGLLVGDAAGAASPLTAGGLDACFRLSHAAAKVIANYLRSGDESMLEDYSGAAMRTRFFSRLWMRGIYERLSHPLAIELACALLRGPLLRPFAHHVFFGRGSFPEIAVRQLASAS